MKDDPVRVVDPAARAWGAPVDGYALSIEPVLLREDRGVVSNLSVVIRNITDEPRTLSVPGWLFFYNVEMPGAPMSPFGRELLKPERRKANIAVPFAPGGLSETQIPIGSIFAMRSGERYTAQVSCVLPGRAEMRSNQIEFTA